MRPFASVMVAALAFSCVVTALVLIPPLLLFSYYSPFRLGVPSRKLQSTPT